MTLTYKGRTMEKGQIKKDDKKDIVTFGKYRVVNDYKFFFIYKKSSKLLSAICLLIDSKNRIGQLKDDLYESTHQLIKDILCLNGLELKESIMNAERRILHIIALLSSASIIDIIDKDNADILIREYSELLEIIPKLSRNPPNIDDQRIFSDFQADFQKLNDEYKRDQTSLNDKNNTAHSRNFHKFGSYENLANRNINEVRKTDPVLLGNKGHNGTNASQKDIERENIAIKVINEGGSASIKDISVHMKDVSEKTVQRLLISMLSKGLIRREGDRRWSRYLLA